MTRIAPAAPISPAELSSLSQFEQVGRLGGAVWAHRPEVSAAMVGVRSALRETGTLSPRLVELIRLRIAFHNQCRSCMAVRYAPDEVDEPAVCSLERPEDAPDLTEAERAALAFADLFATNHLAIDDAVFERLRRHFDEGQLLELSIQCAIDVGFGRMAATWHNVEALPASFQKAQGETVTPWGHGEVLVRPR